jgi:CRP-like cAMP-binding protein
MLERLIRKLERRAEVSDGERRFLEEAPWSITEHEANDSILSEGEPPTESCLVLEGFAYRSKLLADGSRQIIAFHIPGDFGDLHSFLLKQMDHGIAASGWCKVARLPHATLHEITERWPSLTRSLWWDSAMDAAILRQWMIGMGRRDAFQQIAHLFCELLVRFQIVGLAEADSYPLPATQEELGDAFGLSTVHVNRTLTELRRQELITVKGRRITILQPQRLMEVSGFDPMYLQVTASNPL